MRSSSIWILLYPFKVTWSILLHCLLHARMLQLISKHVQVIPFLVIIKYFYVLFFHHFVSDQSSANFKVSVSKRPFLIFIFAFWLFGLFCFWFWVGSNGFGIDLLLSPVSKTSSWPDIDLWTAPICLRVCQKLLNTKFASIIFVSST